ncbi:unnamed protein product [Phytomonas sp. EM1]|nr:unnamed protein product [Phytomonas sp. EM1]|eukprot:CCW63902.1 unnamed protein product [Phytomonas sp. isolate EM1]
MISTLFFDESDSNTVLRVRPQSCRASPEFPLSDSTNAAAHLSRSSQASLLYHYPSFEGSGAVAVPALHAMLFWWLEGCGRNHLHLLAVNDDECAHEARDSQSRMLSVELPIPVVAGDELRSAEGLLACGVSRLADSSNCLVVTWISTTLELGYLRVILQRDTDARGTILLTPEGSMVEGIYLERIRNAFSQDRRRGGGGFAVSRLLASVHTKGCTNALIPFTQCDTQSKDLTTTSRPSSDPHDESDYGDLRACVLSEIPEDRSDVVAIFVVTNGLTLWHAELHLDGSVQARLFKENSRREETVNWFNKTDLTEVSTTLHQNMVHQTGKESPKSNQKSWFGRLFNPNDKRKSMGTGGDSDSNGNCNLNTPNLRYAAVTAIQNTPYVGLLRWNGMFELYDHDLNPLEYYPICPLPLGEVITAVYGNPLFVPEPPLPFTRVHQWASYNREASSIHIFTCIGTRQGRHFVWSRLPRIPHSVEDRFVMQCSYSVVPPIASGSPIGCTVDAAERLAVVWDLGIEEETHLMCLRSISSALHPACDISGVLQILEANPGPEKEWQWSSTNTFLCIGARLGGVVSHGAHLVLLEHRLDYHRAYVVQFARHWLQHLIEVKQLDILSDIVDAAEGSVQDVAPGSTEHILPPRSLCLVSTADLDSKTVSVLYQLPSCTTFWEGWDVLQLSARGVEDLTDILSEAFKLPLSGCLPSLSRLLSDAASASYMSSGKVSEGTVRIAIREAMRAELQFSLPGISLEVSLPSVLTTPNIFFFSYSRRYIMHSVLRELLNRIAFLAITFVGWASSSAWSLESPATSELTRAIAFLAAAHHVVCVSGPELVCLIDATTVKNTDDIVGQILQIFLYPSPYDLVMNATDSLESSRFVMRVADRLRRAGGTRSFKAAVAWAAQLRHWHPILQHYTLLHDLSAGRTTNSTHQLAMCQTVCSSLSTFTDGVDLSNILLDLEFLMSDGEYTSSWSAMLSSPQRREELRCWIQKEPGMAVKLYVVGVLRRFIPTNTLVMHVSASIVHRYYFVELLLVLQHVLAGPLRQQSKGSLPNHTVKRNTCAEEGSEGDAEEVCRPDGAAEAQGSVLMSSFSAPSLQFALEELRIETLLCLSYAGLTDFDFSSSFHDLEDAFNLSEKLGILDRYLESSSIIMDGIIECACTSEQHMEALLAVSNTTVRLDEVLVGKWYNYVARMPTRSSTEALRYRAIIGLYRYLMHRHAYAQCGRVMSDIASLLRCSPQHHSAGLSISVDELASMALHAVQMIYPLSFTENSSTTTGEQTLAGLDSSEDCARMNPALVVSTLPSAIPWHSAQVPGMEATSYARRLLSPLDLPWLERRVYQAHCERKLWQRGNMLDCPDLWVDGAPRGDFELAVKKLTSALMESKLWPEAYRFATLAEADACEVLEEWVTHLVREADLDGDTRDDVIFEWSQLIEYCAEQSTLGNQFMGYRRVVKTALNWSYTKTLPDLRDAHRAADPYSAIATLLEVFHNYQQHVDQEESHKDRDEENVEVTTFRRAQAWLPWVDAARIAIDFLQMSKKSSQFPQHCITNGQSNKVGGENDKVERVAMTLTAGVLDPLARYGKELLQQPDVMRHLEVVNVDEVARELLASISC